MGELRNITISFRIISNTHTIDDVTRIIGVEPTGNKVFRRGDTTKTIWYVEETSNQEQSIDTRIRSLVASVTAARDTWPKETTHWRKELFCGLFLETWNEGCTLSSATLQLLVQDNIDLSFDIYDSTARNNESM